MSEDQVRKRLMDYHGTDIEVSAQKSAELLLSLEVEAYRRHLAAAQEGDDGIVRAPEHNEDHYRDYEAWLLEEREFWKEVEQDLLRPSDTPDWRALRERQRAKNEYKSVARLAQLELKQKKSWKAQRRQQRPGQKYRGCRSSHRINSSADDIWLCQPLLDDCSGCRL